MRKTKKITVSSNINPPLHIQNGNIAIIGISDELVKKISEKKKKEKISEILKIIAQNRKILSKLDDAGIPNSNN